MNIKYFSMFSGIGGFEYGIEKEYNNKPAHISEKSEQEECRQGRKWNPDEPRALLCAGNDTTSCVGFSEIDKYAVQIYKKHFPEHRNFGDATKINPEDLPDFDLLCGGFPCQSFSIAGKRKGFQDIRGTLFAEIVRIAKAKRPRLLLLENVKGLLSIDSGRCFATIISSLDELGYSVEWEVLNSKNFGVPQNRERVFIIGHLGRESIRQIFPLGENGESFDTERLPKEMLEQIAQTLRARDYANMNGNFVLPDLAGTLTGGGHSGGLHSDMTVIPELKELTHNVSDAQRVYDSEGLAKTLKGLGGGLGAKTGLYAVLSPDRINKRQNGRRFKDNGEPAFTLTGQDIHGISDGTRIRRLTPTECERLQGFPDGWTEGISDTQRYKCLGNAVTTTVITAIFERLRNTV